MKMAKPNLYIEYRGDVPAQYCYCTEEWEVMRFFMEGGYRTEEEARLAWERENGRRIDNAAD
jgi:hypothetical protein